MVRNTSVVFGNSYLYQTSPSRIHILNQFTSVTTVTENTHTHRAQKLQSKQ